MGIATRMLMEGLPSTYPAAWGGLKDLLAHLDADAIQAALVTQLEFKPSAEVYDFLRRTSELAAKFHLSKG